MGVRNQKKSTMRAFATILLSGLVLVTGLILFGQIHPWLRPLWALASLLWFTFYAYTRQVDILAAMGKRRVALKLLDSEIERNPQKAVTYVRRARLYYHENKLREAAQDYNQALDLGGHTLKAVIYTELGQVYFRAGKYPRALQAFEAAYAVKARFHPTLAWLAIGHYAQRNFPEARIWWQAARRKRKRYARLNGTNWVRPQPGWLAPACTEAQKITALLNAHGQY